MKVQPVLFRLRVNQWIEHLVKLCLCALPIVAAACDQTGRVNPFEITAVRRATDGAEAYAKQAQAEAGKLEKDNTAIEADAGRIRACADRAELLAAQYRAKTGTIRPARTR